jgi:Domain of unknown function (DUF1844)
MSESDFPPVPATFEFLVFSLKMQAEVRLGLLNVPGESGDATDLGAARHAIDMLAMLAEKTRGNLTIEEQRLVENSLTELRFRFVQVSEKARKPADPAPHPPEPAERAQHVESSADSSESKAAESEPESGKSETAEE